MALTAVHKHFLLVVFRLKDLHGGADHVFKSFDCCFFFGYSAVWPPCKMDVTYTCTLSTHRHFELSDVLLGRIVNVLDHSNLNVTFVDPHDLVWVGWPILGALIMPGGRVATVSAQVHDEANFVGQDDVPE